MNAISNQRAVLETIFYQVYVYNTIYGNWEFCTELVNQHLAEEWISRNMEDGCQYRINRTISGIVAEGVKRKAKE